MIAEDLQMHSEQPEETKTPEPRNGHELLDAELLATVGHELRSPLASIKGYAATLLHHEHRLTREERLEFLAAIHDASHQLSTVIDHMLEIAELETNATIIQPSATDAVQLARETIAAVEHLKKSASGSPLEPGMFKFKLSVKDEVGQPVDSVALIQADAQRLREVIDQLLENAMKYSSKDGIIEIVIHPIPQEQYVKAVAEGRIATQVSQRMVEICVCDDGTGIPVEHLERIFDRFHRVDTRLTREVNGLGLGLAICKRIVELHHGAIWAESTPGKGSTFHVWLPTFEIEGV